MKDLLSTEEFAYYLRSQADFCITSTVSYLPVLCMEVDSRYHDEPDQQARDTVKNKIFELGGVPLMRVRPYGRPTEQSVRQHLCEELRSFGEQLRHTERSAGQYVNTLFEIDFSVFGVSRKE